jgi:outer membrane protein
MKPNRVLALLLLSVATSLKAAPAPGGEPLPLWDAGLLAGGLYSPDYPAAASNHWNGLALPYAYYRGQRLRADQAGLRGRFSLGERLEFSLGLGGAFPVRSRDNAEREGMPDLGYLLEAGPTIGYRLYADGDSKLRLLAQARAVFAVSGDDRGYQGLALQPELSYRRNGFLRPDLQLLAGVWARFGQDGLNRRFYEVRPADVRPDRPAYQARDGYQQSALSLGLRHRFSPDLSLFLGGQLFLTTAATNSESPLFRRNSNFTVGAALQYRLFHSKQTLADQD